MPPPFASNGRHLAIGRQDHAVLVQVPGSLRKAQRHAARKRHVALVREKALAGHVHGDERGRAGGLYRQARPAQIELVRNPGGEKVLVIADHHLIRTDRGERLRIGEQIRDNVGVHRGAGKHADRPRQMLHVVARILDRLPGAFEEDALLRVHGFRLTRIHAEERRIEFRGALERGDHLDVPWIGDDPRVDAESGYVLISELLQRLHARAQIAPELRDVSRSREASRHADDGNRRRRHFSRRAHVADPLRSAALRRTPRSRASIILSSPTESLARCAARAATVEYWKNSTMGNTRLRRSLDTALHLHDEQRVPAEVEEIVVAAHSGNLEHVLPDGRNSRLGLIRGRNVTGARRRGRSPPAPAAPCDRSCRSA